MAAVIGTLNANTNTTTGGYGENFDPNGTRQVAVGGQSSALFLTTAQVVSAVAGRLVKLTPITPGSGTLVINDAATLAGSTTTNQILSLTTTQVAALAATPITLEWPCINGITVSALPAGGQYAMSFNT